MAPRGSGAGAGTAGGSSAAARLRLFEEGRFDLEANLGSLSGKVLVRQCAMIVMLLPALPAFLGKSRAGAGVTGAPGSWPQPAQLSGSSQARQAAIQAYCC